jgi:hypothetical protein
MKFAKLASITGIALLTVLALPSTLSAQMQTLTVLHTITGIPDGARPVGRLLLDPAGNLYGVPTIGGMNPSKEGSTPCWSAACCSPVLCFRWLAAVAEAATGHPRVRIPSR